MNIFFPIVSNYLRFLLTVPKFKNRSENMKNVKLFSMHIENNQWIFNKADCQEDENFFYVNEKLNLFHKFYFLALDKEVERLTEQEHRKFINLNNYTDTEPAFRSNIRIYNSLGGFSSYQSEYPFSMSQKKGSILSPLSTLLFKDADYNKLFFVNFFSKAIKDNFTIFFIDILEKKVLHKVVATTNTINEIEINREFLGKNIYLFSENYIGIPIFVSCKDGQLSCEHTHPPHEYIVGNDKFKVVSEVKSRINDIIS